VPLIQIKLFACGNQNKPFKLLLQLLFHRPIRHTSKNITTNKTTATITTTATTTATSAIIATIPEHIISLSTMIAPSKSYSNSSLHPSETVGMCLSHHCKFQKLQDPSSSHSQQKSVIIPSYTFQTITTDNRNSDMAATAFSFSTAFCNLRKSLEANCIYEINGSWP